MSRTPSWQRHDPLGAALHRVRLEGTFYCRSELSAPWGLTMPPMDGCLWFHAVTRGRFTLEGRGIGRRELGAGDFALVPHGRGHVLRTDRRVAVPVVTDLAHELVGERYARLRHGLGGERTTLVCGIVRVDHSSSLDLFASLPPVIHLASDQLGPSEWIESTLRLMAREAEALRPGGETVITRLADVLVIQAIRTWLDSDEPTGPGLLAAARDERIGRAIGLVHGESEVDWSLDSLAAEVGMSRSGFAARFSELVGETPIRYLTRHRMRVAAELLRAGSHTSSQLAGRFGYSSEAAFHRAFKRWVGATPGSLKPERRAPRS